MKIVASCGPNDVWYETIQNEEEEEVSWKGQGIWSTSDVIRLISGSSSNIEVVTDLSNSTTTHPLIQTVLDRRVDFAPYEFGITLKRQRIVGKKKCFILKLFTLKFE